MPDPLKNLRRHDVVSRNTRSIVIGASDRWVAACRAAADEAGMPLSTWMKSVIDRYLLRERGLSFHDLLRIAEDNNNNDEGDYEDGMQEGTSAIDFLATTITTRKGKKTS